MHLSVLWSYLVGKKIPLNNYNTVYKSTISNKISKHQQIETPENAPSSGVKLPNCKKILLSNIIKISHRGDSA